MLKTMKRVVSALPSEATSLMLVPAGIKVHMAVGYTDMRKGIDGLAVLVEQILEKDPFSGHMFVFRGKRADMIKVLFWDGSGVFVC